MGVSMTFRFATVSEVDTDDFSDKLKKATTFGLSAFTGWYKIALLPNLQQNRKNALDTSPKHYPASSGFSRPDATLQRERNHCEHPSASLIEPPSSVMDE